MLAYSFTLFLPSKLKMNQTQKQETFSSIVNICILPAYLNLNVNADGGAEWSLLWFRSIPDEFFVLNSNLEQTSYAARVKVNEGRCPAEIEHPLRNLLKKKKKPLLLKVTLK